MDQEILVSVGRDGTKMIPQIVTMSPLASASSPAAPFTASSAMSSLSPTKPAANRRGPVNINTPLTPGPSPLSSPGHGSLALGRPRQGSTLDDVHDLLGSFDHLTLDAKREFLTKLLNGKRRQSQIGWLDTVKSDALLPSTLLLEVSSILRPLLKRDFLSCLPTELALLILSNIEDVKTLVRCGGVSQAWRSLVLDEGVWKRMCQREGFFQGVGGTPVMLDDSDAHFGRRHGKGRPHAGRSQDASGPSGQKGMPVSTKGSEQLSQMAIDAEDSRSPRDEGMYPSTAKERSKSPASYRDHFRSAYLTEQAWLRGGVMKASHQSLAQSILRSGVRARSAQAGGPAGGDFEGGIVTSLSMDAELVAVGMNNRKIHVFSMDTGALKTTLHGHSGEVWCLVLISRMSRLDPHSSEGRTAAENAEAHSQTSCGSAIGWGNKEPLLISGGCDKNLRLWSPLNGACIRTFEGHTSTVRCIKVINRRPIVVSGSRDGTLRVWNMETGRLLHALIGHSNSVRCIEAHGNIIVSGSYDTTARVWNVDTGACLHTLSGHYQHIYAVAFDGVKIATGSLDSCVSVWSAATGERLAVLQGHTSLVGQLQLWNDILVTGGSDGTLRVWALSKKAVQSFGSKTGHWNGGTGVGIGLGSGFDYGRQRGKKALDLVDDSGENSSVEHGNDELTYMCIHHIAAHDHSLTSLLFDQRRILSGGNDGRVKMWDLRTGSLIRELIKPPTADAIWRLGSFDDKVVILTKRGEETGMDLISFQAQDLEGGT